MTDNVQIFLLAVEETGRGQKLKLRERGKSDEYSTLTPKLCSLEM